VRSTGFHHLDIVVTSIERSLPFYRDLLGPLGWHGLGEVQGERGETIHYISGPGSSLGLREAMTPSEGPYDRYRVGLHHIAFEAPTRSAVDERTEWLRVHEVELESDPQAYWYLPGYYAVFFYDPDGLKLELVHVPAHAA
jgi:catechol 2,3-dioxygenase-like lactoylglutathione lyase family enzyme